MPVYLSPYFPLFLPIQIRMSVCWVESSVSKWYFPFPHVLPPRELKFHSLFSEALWQNQSSLVIPSAIPSSIMIPPFSVTQYSTPLAFSATPSSCSRMPARRVSLNPSSPNGASEIWTGGRGGRGLSEVSGKESRSLEASDVKLIEILREKLHSTGWQHLRPLEWTPPRCFCQSSQAPSRCDTIESSSTSTRPYSKHPIEREDKLVDRPLVCLMVQAWWSSS